MANAIERPTVVYEFVGTPTPESEEKDRVIVNPKPVKPTPQSDEKTAQPQKKVPTWFKGTGK